MGELLLALALVAFSPDAQEIRRDGVSVGTVWARTSAPVQRGERTERAFFSSISRGEILARIRFHVAWRDARGQEVPPGTYTLRYAVQPVLKDHAGTSRWRDFAIIGDRRDGHPWVMALAPAGEADLVLVLGELRVGLLLNTVAESAF
jgi:hypothetical protein